ncbi:hypothetical protein ED733_005361 [Metarhizium rileyi]|uniref:Hemerythrin-like domain-containing protein n=1 Tax=Metarhizium rileyi (strain RCEF 4871) TaxID=1649241 RepID=A0A5C6GAL4_METRR|nr:hypothetical protein ED733_005361 [Metarhizium rileyi]
MAGDDSAAKDAAAAETASLPPLSDHEFKIYNRMADAMEQYHNYFRQTWTLLWTAATTSRRPQNLTVKQFLNEAISFTRHLSTHHGIEEAHIFPLLATRMPEFDAKGGKLVRQHEQIHQGLEGFEAYVRKCHAGREDLEMGVLKEKMEAWGGVLWEHLDEEVRMLGAERMRVVWSKEEMMRMPM